MKFPSVAFGTAAIGGIVEKVEYDDAMVVLEHAWDSGIRFFDTAPHYGQGLAERRLGDFLRRKPMDQWILSTKVGRILKPDCSVVGPLNKFVEPLPFRQIYDYSYDGIMRSVEDSFQRLGLCRIDILLAHDLGRFAHGDKWRSHVEAFLASGHQALEELKRQKVIKACGLGVNESEVCIDILQECDLDIIVLAGRYTLLDQSAEDVLFPLCEKRNVQLVIGAVFNSGILVTGATNNALYNYRSPTDKVIAKVKALEEICAQYDVPLPAAAMAFPMRNRLVTSVLTGPGKLAQLKENLRLMNRAVPDTIWRDVERLEHLKV